MLVSGSEELDVGMKGGLLILEVRLLLKRRKAESKIRPFVVEVARSDDSVAYSLIILVFNVFMSKKPVFFFSFEP